MAATARLDMRLRPEARAMIERAAAVLDEPVSEFVRTTVEQRAAQVLADHDARTRVPAAFFDEVLAALEAPASPRTRTRTRACRPARPHEGDARQVPARALGSARQGVREAT